MTKAKHTHHAPPADLAAPEAEVWRRLQAEYGLTDAPAIILLAQLTRNLQLIRECHEVIAREGKMLSNKPHALLLVARDCEKIVATALRALNCDLEPLRDAVGRPPGR